MPSTNVVCGLFKMLAVSQGHGPSVCDGSSGVNWGLHCNQCVQFASSLHQAVPHSGCACTRVQLDSYSLMHSRCIVQVDAHCTQSLPCNGCNSPARAAAVAQCAACSLGCKACIMRRPTAALWVVALTVIYESLCIVSISILLLDPKLSMCSCWCDVLVYRPSTLARQLCYKRCYNSKLVSSLHGCQAIPSRATGPIHMQTQKTAAILQHQRHTCHVSLAVWPIRDTTLIVDGHQPGWDGHGQLCHHAGSAGL
jgi:hypothetical protein